MNRGKIVAGEAAQWWLISQDKSFERDGLKENTRSAGKGIRDCVT
jgi:hypothetical protein